MDEDRAVLEVTELDDIVVATPVVSPAPAVPLPLQGTSPAIRRTRGLLARAARERRNVLLVCEAGLQPETAGRVVHAGSDPGDAYFAVLDCGGLEPVALELALFGVRNGARATSGLERVAPNSHLASAAAGGTLVLTNLVELSAPLQARLARVARDGEVLVPGVGGVRFQARLIGAVSPGIEDDVKAGRFRSDLLRRVARVRIDLPPLRARREDVPLLAREVMRDLCGARAVPVRSFTRAAEALLAALPWRENLDELRRLLEHLAEMPTADPIKVEHVLALVRLDDAPTVAPGATLKEARRRFEREYIAAVLSTHGWRMAEAALTLGINRPNLYRKARQLGVTRVRPGERA